MNYKNSALLLGLWLLLPLSPMGNLPAQTVGNPGTPAYGAVTGKVSDAATGSGLQGASVRVEGTAYESGLFPNQ